MSKYEIYTDGACSNNPGPGAFAFIVIKDNKEIERVSKKFEDTTNNKMELMAVIEALKKYSKYEVVIYTDSEYVKKGITEWINNWKIKNWKTANKKDVKNKDLWILLDELKNENIIFKWVRGHSGNHWNEEVDALAVETISN